MNESFDLLSLKQGFYFLLLGVLPAVLIAKTELTVFSFRKSLLNRVVLIGGSLFICVALILLFSNFYASFFREHKPLRFYANPSYYLYSIGKTIGQSFDTGQTSIKKIGVDAKIDGSDEHRELIIFVVGETARSDHFSLNGYGKKTNPYLEKENVISFKNIWACGTSTSYSVPCLFSIYDRSDYSKDKAKKTENVLDILQRAGVNVIWLDNNSDSKGVANRIPYLDFKTAKNNPNCDIECRDEGMLVNLQKYIDAHPTGDIFIVLHQMGNHGPTYYKRYPKAFEVFVPTCNTNLLEQCSNNEINNAYDNALLYTDYFLSKTISLLKNNTSNFEAAMIYVSDHGESLGENNLYLHGLPYIFAPEEQLHIPLIMWFGEGFDEHENHIAELKSKTQEKFSHDNIFHTILGLMEIETEVYDRKKDMILHDE